MCGILGVISKQPIDSALFKMSLGKMNHRGPDQSETWHNKGVSLGHVRLSINDLSENGKQPMKDDKGVIVFNGEIYNYKTLKKQLEDEYSCEFVSDSDTEVLLKLLGLFSIDEVLNRVEGMFAFAYYSFLNDEVYLSRDYCGEKPLFVFQNDELIIFASEQKSILTLLGKFNPNTNITNYLQRGYFTGAACSLDSCFRLKPNSILKIELGKGIVEFKYDVVNINKVKHIKSPIKSINQSVVELEDLLFETVDKMLDADVPVCTFLSGGVDSSLITAIAAKLKKTNIESYTIGFHEKKFDESEFAINVANHLNVNLHSRIVTGEDALNTLNLLPSVYDEPVSDPSIFPTLLLCEFASKNYKVALSGDGADEIFLGYSRYMQTIKRFKKLNRIPGVIRKPIGLALGLNKKSPFWNRFSDYLLHGKTLSSFYEISTNKFAYNDLPTLSHSNRLPTFDSIVEAGSLTEAEYLGLIDVKTYMVDDVLVKVDRASMNYSLETRAPFLSKNIIEFANNLPSEFKSNCALNKSKYILKEVLKRHVPDKLIDRPKRGFAAPVSAWMKGSLYDWSTNLIEEGYKMNTGIDMSRVKAQFNHVIKGEERFADGVWTALVYLNWIKFNNEK